MSTAPPNEHRPLDAYLPRFDAVERHELAIDQPIDTVWEALLRTDFGRSKIIRWLFAARGMTSVGGIARPLTIETLVSGRFAILERRPPELIVIGLVGRFWTPGGGLQRIDRQSFLTGTPAGFASAAWSFELESIADSATLAATETRIATGDDKSRRSFKRYWRFIGPFSALIRRQMLSQIAAEATSPVSSS